MLEINGLVKHYGDFTLNCTMKVGPGRITGLVGENGAGKSTTFKAALGLITYDAGNITLMGKAPADLTPVENRRSGVTLAESGFSGYLKVKDVVPVMAACTLLLTERSSLICAGSSEFRRINISRNSPRE